MQAQKNNSLLFILKILTPDEIDRYCNEGVEKKVVKKLAAGAELLSWDEEEVRAVKKRPKRALPGNRSSDDDKAKILPFNSPKSVEQPSSSMDEQQDISPTSNGSELESVGILSAAQIQEIQQREKKKQESQQESASVFLINQRKKLKASQARLIELQAIQNYQKSSQYIPKQDVEEIDLEQELSEERERFLNSGVLFNKKQY